MINNNNNMKKTGLKPVLLLLSFLIFLGGKRKGKRITSLSYIYSSKTIHPYSNRFLIEIAINYT